MTPELQELIDAGKTLYAMTEKLGTMAAEYVRWSDRMAALVKWRAALLGVEGYNRQRATRRQPGA